MNKNVVKEEIDKMSEDAAVSYCYKGVWSIENHPKVQRSSSDMYTHYRAGFIAGCLSIGIIKSKTKKI